MVDNPVDVKRAFVSLGELRRAKHQALDSYHCVRRPMGCGKAITGFRDALSVRDYEITGLCQECQDRVYKEEDE